MNIQLIPAGRRATAKAADSAAIDAMGDHPPVPIQDGNDLVDPDTGEVLATIEHRFDFLAAHERAKAAWRAKR